MPKFLIDENVRREVDEFLQRSGHDAIRPPRGAPDGEVAALAKKESRILITHDRGFSNIFRFPPQEYAGIIVIRIFPPSGALITDALTGLLHSVSALEFSGQLFILEPSGFRVYKKGE